MGDYEGAESAFETALEVAPSFYMPEFNRALLHCHLGDEDKARGSFKRLVARFPELGVCVRPLPGRLEAQSGGS